MVYEDAVDSHACHDFRLDNLASTIYYKEAGDDNLYFSLLFKSRDNAHTFQVKLIVRLQNSFNNNMACVFNNNRMMDVIETTAVARYMYPEPYSFPPENSVHDCSVTELSNIEDPLRSLRSFEKLSLIPRKETIYECRIAPMAYYKGPCATDPDNILYESHRFRVYFDGDGRRRPRGASLDWGKPPEMWIDYVDVEPNATTVNGVRYHQVFVNIMFRDVQEANSMRGLWKDGTEDIGDIGFRTSFFTTNAVKVKKYLEIKKRETRIRWGVKEDMVTLQNVDIEEEEVVELAESGEMVLDLDNEY
jgi:hypothetical protein